MSLASRHLLFGLFLLVFNVFTTCTLCLSGTSFSNKRRRNIDNGSGSSHPFWYHLQTEAKSPNPTLSFLGSLDDEPVEIDVLNSSTPSDSNPTSKEPNYTWAHVLYMRLLDDVERRVNSEASTTSVFGSRVGV